MADVFSLFFLRGGLRGRDDKNDHAGTGGDQRFHSHQFANALTPRGQARYADRTRGDLAVNNAKLRRSVENYRKQARDAARARDTAVAQAERAEAELALLTERHSEDVERFRLEAQKEKATRKQIQAEHFKVGGKVVVVVVWGGCVCGGARKRAINRLRTRRHQPRFQLELTKSQNHKITAHRDGSF